MALPDSLKIVVGTDIVLADTTDHPPSAANIIGVRTDQIDCTDLVAGAARQSAKFDFGTNMDAEYVFSAAIEWEVTPEIAAGEVVDFYMGYSVSAVDGTANPGGLSGSDAAYTGYGAGGLAASLKQLVFIGSMIMDNVITTDQTQIQMGIATFRPRHQHGMLVVVNNAASAAFHSDMVETTFLIQPLVHQAQD